MDSSETATSSVLIGRRRCNISRGYVPKSAKACGKSIVARGPVHCDRGDMRFVIALTFLVSCGSGTAAAGGKWDCGIVALVTRVFDGDTVDVAGLGRVRLLGIDAPEIGGAFERPAPFALEARDELQSLLLQRWARFDCDGDPEDIYGRRLAYITLETGEFINARLVRDGVAR